MELRPCPRCEGRGYIVHGRYTRQDPACDVCSGRGWVTLDVCEGCGRPAWCSGENCLPWCGRSECLAKMLPKPRRKYNQGGIRFGPTLRETRPGVWERLPDEDERQLWEGYCC